jgi:uncharacterized protein
LKGREGKGPVVQRREGEGCASGPISMWPGSPPAVAPWGGCWLRRRRFLRYDVTMVEFRSFAAPPVPLDLLDPVVAYFRPRRVILFGSAARGDGGFDSDIDLLVVVDDDVPPERLTLKAGYESRRSYRRAADVIPVRQQTFERNRRIPGTLSEAASREGIVVYERA